jgi:PadR family transcriptional regulator, regulatory protein PadR
MRAESLKGHLDGMILAIVGAAPAHGYAVIEELKQRSGGAFDLPEGTVYPALHRLEAAGRLTSAWSETGGRRRRTYQLTGDGVVALRAERGAWRSFSAGIGAVLAGTA